MVLVGAMFGLYSLLRGAPVASPIVILYYLAWGFVSAVSAVLLWKRQLWGIWLSFGVLALHSVSFRAGEIWYGIYGGLTFWVFVFGETVVISLNILALGIIGFIWYAYVAAKKTEI
jgi:hypothetical protein